MPRKQFATRLAARVLAGALLLGAAPFVAATTPAAAQQFNGNIGFYDFYDRLAPHGEWYRHPCWGDVWHPTRIRDYRPYERGYWENTREYGWVWISDDPWGDIPSHYGRWVYDPYDGWLWIPGYVWSPAWVVWRTGGGYVGWFPMPPDDRFLRGDEIYRNNWDNWDRGFGYADWYGPQYGFEWSISFWNFVDQRHFGDRDYRRWTPPMRDRGQFFRNTRNTTNYITINNYIVNRSVDNREIERLRGRAITTVSARDVIRRDSIVTRVDVGRQIQDRERRQHGGNTNASPRERVVSLPPNRAIAPDNNRPGFDRPDRNDNRGNGGMPEQGRGRPDGDRNAPGMPDRGPNRAPQARPNIPQPQEDPRGVTRGLNPRQENRPEARQPQMQPQVQRGNVEPQGERNEGARGNDERNQPARDMRDRNRRMPDQRGERQEQAAPPPNMPEANRFATRPGNQEPRAEAPQAGRRMPNAQRENANDDDNARGNGNARNDREERRQGNGPEGRGNSNR